MAPSLLQPLQALFLMRFEGCAQAGWRAWLVSAARCPVGFDIDRILVRPDYQDLGFIRLLRLRRRGRREFGIA
jgi:hypothetical protein